MCKHAPGVHDDGLIAVFGLIQVGCGDDDAQSLVAHQLQDDFPKFASRQRIDADCGFVKEEKLRRANERAGKAQLLLHASRQFSREPTRKGSKLRHVHQTRVDGLALIGRHAVQIRVEIEILLDAEILIEAEFLRHITDPVLHRLRHGSHIEPNHLELTRIRFHQAADEAQQRGFAGSVGTNDRRQRALSGFERNIVEGYNRLPRLPAEHLFQASRRHRELVCLRCHDFPSDCCATGDVSLLSAMSLTVAGMPSRN